MNEQEWLASDNPVAILECLLRYGPVSERKLRLFCVNCLQLRAELKPPSDPFIPDKEDWENAETGPTNLPPIQWAMCWAELKLRDYPSAKDKANLLREIFGNPFRPAGTHTVQETKAAKDTPGRENYLFGELKVEAVPWLTSDIRAQAEYIYETRDWELMGQLADALTEAGCDNQEILDHCHGLELIPDEEMPNKYRWRKLRGPHVRGCWVIDLLTGRL